MSSIKQARPYAECLHELIKEKSEQEREEILADYKALLDFVQKEVSFRVFMEAPGVSRVNKKELLEKSLRKNCHDLLVNFLAVLVQNGGFSLVEDIYHQIEKLMEEESDIVRVSVTTANELTEENRSRITLKLKEKLQADIILEEQVNPDILGGFIIRIDDTIVNNSIKYHLNQIKKCISERSVSYGI